MGTIADRKDLARRVERRKVRIAVAHDRRACACGMCGAKTDRRQNASKK